MTNTPDSLAAVLVAPLLTRNKDNIIIAQYKITDTRRTVALWVQAFKLTDDREDGIAGLVDAEEYVKLTVPLTGPVKPLIEEWIVSHLPGFVLADWQTWQEPVCCGEGEWF